MARESKIVGLTQSEIDNRQLTVKKIMEEYGYSSSGAVAAVLSNAGLKAYPARNGNGEAVASQPRKPVTACLPVKTEAWIKAQLGIDPDEDLPEGFSGKDFVMVDTVFYDHPNYRRHLARLSGGDVVNYDSDAVKALRAWVGQPLTREQRELEDEERINRERNDALNALNAAGAVFGVYFSSENGLLEMFRLSQPQPQPQPQQEQVVETQPEPQQPEPQQPEPQQPEPQQPEPQPQQEQVVETQPEPETGAKKSRSRK